MPVIRRALVSLLVCLLVSGCDSGSDQELAQPGDAGASAIYPQTIALLHQLMSEERHLSKLLLVKKESDALEEIVKEISDTAGKHADALEELAKREPRITIDASPLPPGEAAARKAIAKAKQDALLNAKGGEFEFQVLLTQGEALNYGEHLARVAAGHAPSAEDAGELLRIASGLEQLRERVLERLRRP